MRSPPSATPGRRTIFTVVIVTGLAVLAAVVIAEVRRRARRKARGGGPPPRRRDPWKTAMPMGPLRLFDLIGLDTAPYRWQTSCSTSARSRSSPPPPLLKRMVAAGKLGRNAGQGFYDEEG